MAEAKEDKVKQPVKDWDLADDPELAAFRVCLDLDFMSKHGVD